MHTWSRVVHEWQLFVWRCRRSFELICKGERKRELRENIFLFLKVQKPTRKLEFLDRGGGREPACTFGGLLGLGWGGHGEGEGKKRKNATRKGCWCAPVLNTANSISWYHTNSKTQKEIQKLAPKTAWRISWNICIFLSSFQLKDRILGRNFFFEICFISVTVSI